MHLRCIYPPLVGKGLGILLNQLINGLLLTPEIFKSRASIEYAQQPY